MVNQDKWERQHGEPPRAYLWFCEYRDMGVSRSVAKVQEKWGKKISINRLYCLSSKYNWVERAEAYDDHMDKLRRAENEEAIRKMSERHAGMAVLIQQKLMQKLQNYTIDEISSADVARLFDVAVKIERLSRGGSTAIEEIQGSVTLKIGKEFDGI
jgi:hypothetical protein